MAPRCFPVNDGLADGLSGRVLPRQWCHEAGRVLDLVRNLGVPGSAGMLSFLERAVDGDSVSLDSSVWLPEFAAAAPTTPLGGCLGQFWRQWRRLVPERTDFWRDVLLLGWQDDKELADFDYTIPDRRPPLRQRAAFEQVYDQLRRLRVLDDSHQGAATTYMFGVPKGNGETRYVLDLTHHNLNEVVPHFQASTERGYIEWLREGTFRLSTDLSKQYWQVPARPSQQRRMVVPNPTGHGYSQFLVLAMGAKGASRVGATMMGLAVAIARSRMGTDAYPYMDEAAIQHEEPLMAQIHQIGFQVLLRYLGARANIPKTRWSPALQLDFIGLRADGRHNLVAPSLHRLEKVRLSARQLRSTATATQGQLASLVGQVRSLLRSHQVAGFQSVRMAQVLGQLTRANGPKAHRSPLSRAKLTYLRQELRFWETAHPALEWRFCPTVRDRSTMVVDSSMYGWGGQATSPLAPNLNTSGFFTKEERSLWHDTLEARGMDLTIRSWLRLLPKLVWTPRSLSVGTDNVTTMTAATKRRTRSVQVASLMADLIPLLHQRGFDLSAFHIGKEVMDSQFSVDAEGRRHSTVWERALPAPLFLQLRQRLGIEPTRGFIDLFASVGATQSPLFVSWKPHPASVWVDALSPGSPRWSETNPLLPEGGFFYAFPPPRMLKAVLDRLHLDRTSCLLVVFPFQSGCSQWSNIVPLLSAPPVLFSLPPGQLVPPEGFAEASSLSSRGVTFVSAILSAGSSGPEGWTRTASGAFSMADGREATLVNMTLGGAVGALGSGARAWASSLFQPQRS